MVLPLRRVTHNVCKIQTVLSISWFIFLLIPVVVAHLDVKKPLHCLVPLSLCVSLR